MNAEPAPQAASVFRTEIEAAQTRYFLASFNLFLVIAMAGLMFFLVSAVEEPGTSENLIRTSIQILCMWGGMIAVGAWLFSWVQLLRLRGRYAKAEPKAA